MSFNFNCSTSNSFHQLPDDDFVSWNNDTDFTGDVASTSTNHSYSAFVDAISTETTVTVLSKAFPNKTTIGASLNESDPVQARTTRSRLERAERLQMGRLQKQWERVAELPILSECRAFLKSTIESSSKESLELWNEALGIINHVKSLDLYIDPNLSLTHISILIKRVSILKDSIVFERFKKLNETVLNCLQKLVIKQEAKSKLGKKNRETVCKVLEKEIDNILIGRDINQNSKQTKKVDFSWEVTVLDKSEKTIPLNETDRTSPSLDPYSRRLNSYFRRSGSGKDLNYHSHSGITQYDESSEVFDESSDECILTQESVLVQPHVEFLNNNVGNRIYPYLNLKELRRLSIANQFLKESPELADSIIKSFERAQKFLSKLCQRDLMTLMRSVMKSSSPIIKSLTLSNIKCLDLIENKEIKRLNLDITPWISEHLCEFQIRKPSLERNVTDFSMNVSFFPQGISTHKRGVTVVEKKENGGVQKKQITIEENKKNEEVQKKTIKMFIERDGIRTFFRSSPSNLSSLTLSSSFEHLKFEQVLEIFESTKDFKKLAELVIKVPIPKVGSIIKFDKKGKQPLALLNRNLKILSICHPQIGAVEDSDIPDLPDLESLDLSDGPIKIEITPDCFRSLPRAITQLNISVRSVGLAMLHERLAELPPPLKELKLRVREAELMPFELIPEREQLYKFNWQDIGKMPQGLTSLDCMLDDQVSEEMVLSVLKKLKMLNDIPNVIQTFEKW